MNSKSINKMNAFNKLAVDCGNNQSRRVTQCQLIHLIVLIAILTISSLCLIELVTARDVPAGSLDLSASASLDNNNGLSGQFDGLASGGQGGGQGSGQGSGQGGGGSVGNLFSQSSFDPTRLLEYTMNPMKYLTPNTYQGISTDLSQGLSMLTNGASQGLNSMQAQQSALGDQLLNRFNSLQQRLMNRQQQLNQQQEAIVGQLAEIFSNPEQFCRRLVDKTQSIGQQASQQASSMYDQASQQPNSFMNQLGNRFFPFLG